jgi:hypothetical protein
LQILPLVCAPGVLCGFVGPISPAVTVLQTPESVLAVEEELAPSNEGIFSILVGAVTLGEGSLLLLDVELALPITTLTMLEDVGGIWAFAAETIEAKFEDGGMVFVGVACHLRRPT